ncbi:hypothetical protein D9M72_410740 [compost metagenome]
MQRGQKTGLTERLDLFPRRRADTVEFGATAGKIPRQRLGAGKQLPPFLIMCAVVGRHRLFEEMYVAHPPLHG